MMKNILNYIKFWLSKINSPKYKLQGSCKQCGRCCKEITFRMNNNLISDEKDFLKLQKEQPFYKNFFISGQDKAGTLLFTCKHLSWENTCQIHIIRPFFCRNYPKIKKNQIPETFEECGYYFKLDKTFQEFINNR